ncbi:MAG: DUF4270 family protein [Bacteroidota bacterium]
MKLFFYLLVAVFLVGSCNQDENQVPTLEIGNEFTDSNVRIIAIDTFEVALSTFKFDSIITSNPERLLVGQYVDTTFGKVSASSYFEMLSLSYSIESEAVLDSVALILGYDNYFYSDTTQTATLQVHRLLDDVKPDDQFFFNSTEIEFEPFPLSVKTYQPEPIDEDSLHVTLPLSFGENLFNAIRDGDINNDEELLQEFKGFMIKGGENDNASVIGYSPEGSETFLRFFYTVMGEFGDEEFIFDFNINGTLGIRNAFNNISSDFTSTGFEGLVDQEIEIQSEDAGNKAYMQSGVGLATKVTFPSIKRITDIPGTGTVISATLQLHPPRGYYSNLLPIRDSLSINIANQNNDFIGPLLINDQPVFGIINTEGTEFNEEFYEIPVGAYVDAKLSELFEVDDSILIYPVQYSESLDRMVLNGENNSNFAAKLILIYAIYDE